MLNEDSELALYLSMCWPPLTLIRGLPAERSGFKREWEKRKWKRGVQRVLSRSFAKNRTREIRWHEKIQDQDQFYSVLFTLRDDTDTNLHVCRLMEIKQSKWKTVQYRRERR